MASPFLYLPLHGDQIRVLKIEPAENVTNTTKRRPIICSLEHVSLPAAGQESSSQQSKGIGRTWPELSVTPDTDALFKNGKDMHASESSTRPTSEHVLAAEDDLPWRHEWGDFIALSYVWGYPKRKEGEPPHLITVDGVAFEVGPNLYFALTQLSRSMRIRQGFKVWIDAICINQADLDERSQQVTRMRDIYQSAWQVVIWLGPEEHESLLAISALYWLARESELDKPMDNFYFEEFSVDLRPLVIIWPRYKSSMKKDVYRALFHFFTRPYWRRMWIVQEVAMGNMNSPVLCGNACISWNDLYKAVGIIATDESRFGREILETVQPRILPAWSFEFARDRLLHERTWAPERMWKIHQTMTKIQNNQKIASESTKWGELVRALNLARDSLVTEEKDRVYGILGIKAIADRVHIEPDYKLSLSAIYTNFTEELLSGGDLNILRLASGHGGYVPFKRTSDNLPPPVRNRSIAPVLLSMLDTVTRLQGKTPVGTPCKHSLPSWAICWSCSPAPTAQLRGMYQADRNLGSAMPMSVITNMALTVNGIVIDTITSLSAFHIDECNERYPDNTFASTCSIYGDIEATREALWRTIVADTIAEQKDQAPETYSWLLDHKLWQRGVAGVYTYGFGLHDFMARNQQLRVCGYTLEQLIFGHNKWLTKFRMIVGDNYYNSTETQRETLSWAINAMAWRRLFGTKNGRMGLGTCAAEINDKIVLLRGCNTPLILREFNGGWKLIGECYTHGVMYGEIIAKEDELVDITIY
ncbi:heterokaryon incompatibility protein-domain-containing protein [Fusarium sp. MPI-SDFR-AT-0072]|uniref:Heterokaryon incompatibility protein 6, OR allele n=1 Tax=Fusarium oxysporum f. sp. rapae TaxID=485398 RepID=A0A8J5NRU1_FUSOX|nr:Heterokaryon incompatibility protein 6, OR allele [Fusarium oxysporum f. sp. rapae]KAH7168344.1 heterokaryon incompatibility protein-domain-containing protein [Fusarium sp. MPI-SDFR-AT-0072]